MKNIYYIGGSPCSGKSTIAEHLVSKFNLYYFKADEHLEEYAKKGAEKNLPICSKKIGTSQEEAWMKDPVLQSKEEILFYKEIFPFILEDISKIDIDKDIVAEGTAFLPELMRKHRISKRKYISITPCKEFQTNYVKQYKWIESHVNARGNFKEVVEKWMDRDCYFANEVNVSSNKTGYNSIMNNGEKTIEELIEIVSKHFKLKV